LTRDTMQLVCKLKKQVQIRTDKKLLLTAKNPLQCLSVSNQTSLSNVQAIGFIHLLNIASLLFVLEVKCTRTRVIN